MSKPIEPGCMAIVVHSPCECAKGFIIKVISIEECNSGDATCDKCSYIYKAPVERWADVSNNTKLGYPVRWLKRLPDLDETPEIYTERDRARELALCPRS